MINKKKVELKKAVKKDKKKNKPSRKPLPKSPAEKNIDENCAFFQTIFENAGFGIVLGNFKGKLLRVNSTIVKMLGYSEKELLQLTIKDITHPHDFKTDQKLFKEVISGKRKRYQIEKRYITKDGKIIHGKLTVSQVDNIKGNVKYFIALVEDLTEHKQAIENLLSQQNLLVTLLDNIPDSIYFKDLNSRFIKVNKACATKLGASKPELLVGKTDADSFGYEHATRAFADEQQIIKTGLPIISKEEREDWSAARTTWASTTKMPLYDSEGKIIGTFGISRDITQLKQSQEIVKESEQLYRSLFEGSDDGMFFTSEDLILDCNQTVLDIFRCDRSFVVGHPPSDFSPEVQPDGRNSYESASDKIMKAYNGDPQRFYWQHKRPDGSLIDCEISLKAITIGGKKIIQATMRDFTERIRSEKIRQALYEISEAAYTASNMSILYKRIHEEIAKLMSVKNIYIALYDEKADIISFPYFVDEFDPPQQSKKPGKGLTEYILRKGEACLITPQRDLELRITGETELIGEPSAIWLGVPLKLGGKTIGVIVVQDYENEKAYSEEEEQILTFVSEQIAQVIERKRNSDAVKKYTEELKQLNSTKDKFFSIIAHDLRNPFITILGFSDLLHTDYAELSDEERLFYLDEMKKSAEISHNLLQNLLQWSRSQTGRIEFNPQKLNLFNIVQGNTDLLKASAERKQIHISHNITEGVFVAADEDMLNTIIRNLLTNALKFTEKGGKVEITAFKQNSFIEISVSDTGVGMSNSVRESLFKLDATHSSFGTDNEAGTGLGLILCKEFVEKNGGTIKVESELGKGTRFIFSLPLAQ
ncbi:MAG: PAS domain S-box protein [Ignavibacteriales bacterium]|nr:PAS domain S-box protein [Ignavibacteriales bacterium]